MCLYLQVCVRMQKRDKDMCVRVCIYACVCACMHLWHTSLHSSSFPRPFREGRNGIGHRLTPVHPRLPHIIERKV